MKELRLYQCEVCGRQFKTAEKAQACEIGHKKNLRITTREYSENDKYGFPIKNSPNIRLLSFRPGDLGQRKWRKNKRNNERNDRFA